MAFFGKPGDINDSWIRVHTIETVKDAVSAMHGLSLRLSAVGTTRTTQTVLAL